MPVEMDTAAEQSAWHAQWGSVRSWATLEKVVLVGLIAVVYGNILPGVRSTTLELFVGVAVIIVINAGFTLALARRSWSIRRGPGVPRPRGRQRRAWCSSRTG